MAEKTQQELFEEWAAERDRKKRLEDAPYGKDETFMEWLKDAFNSFMDEREGKSQEGGGEGPPRDTAPMAEHPFFKKIGKSA